MSDQHDCWNADSETLGSDKYLDFHGQALRRQLAHVWQHSLFYQRKFRDAGIDPEDIQSIEDLSRLPFTHKSELRDSQAEVSPLGTHIAAAPTAVKRIYSTSGTTGRPTYIGLTEHDIDVWKEAACRTFWCCGLRADSITPLVVSPFVIAASYADALEKIGTLVPIGVGATDRLIDSFQHAHANTLLCTSSFPLHFAAGLEKRGIDPRKLGIRLILAGGEPGASIPWIRQQIEETYNCQLMELSGNGDMCGLMWAECKHKRGMHFIAQGIVHPEIIDPDTGEVLAIREGTTGELVYTSLDRECIPLVRFRTSDQVQVTHTECDCSRTGFGIRIIGRTDDMMIVQGVNVYPSAIRDVVTSLAPQTNGTVEVQLYTAPPDGWKPPVHIKVEYSNQAVDLASLKVELENLIREKLFFRANIELVANGQLPRYEYKAKLVNKLYNG